MRDRPLALVLFSCSGGVDKGLEAAGFDTIGVDLMPSQLPADDPRRSRDDGTQFWTGDGECHMADLATADAVDGVIRAFKPDFVAASPPCPRFSFATPSAARDKHPDLIASTREGILRSGVPGWIENVDTDRVPFTGWWVMLCGSMFPETYHLVRHRRFELQNWRIPQPRHDRLLCRNGSDAHVPCALCEDLAPSSRRMAVAVAGHGPPDAVQSARYKSGRNGARRLIVDPTAGSNARGAQAGLEWDEAERKYVREVVTVAGDGSGNRGRGSRRKTLTLAGNQGEGPGQNCGQNRAGEDCVRWRLAMGWPDGPRDRYSLRQAIPPAYSRYLGGRFLETRR